MLSHVPTLLNGSNLFHLSDTICYQQFNALDYLYIEEVLEALSISVRFVVLIWSYTFLINHVLLLDCNFSFITCEHCNNISIWPVGQHFM